VGTPGSPPP